MISLKTAAVPSQVPRDLRTSRAARSPIALSGRVETIFAASLSAGAAAIHLAAASSHLESLGDLALGFYWAALFQVAFAVAVLAHPQSRRLAGTGVAINLALIAAWAWSRTIGLPTISGGPESVGLADATTVAFQVVLVWLLATRLGLSRPGGVGGRSADRLGRMPGLAFIVGTGVVLISTPIAMADGAAGHVHGGAGHVHAEGARGLTQPVPMDAHSHGDALGH